MPPARPQRNSERRTTNRAASVPVGQCEISGLESILRSKKQKDTPPADLPARGRKRDSSSCATSQARCMASSSASLVGKTADASEQRPRKRHKRSSSTPPVPRSSQLSTQLQSRRRSRSRLGSPFTDVEYVPPSRGVTRLSRKTHSFMINGSSDIYTHLAGPDGAANLLSEPVPGSIILSAQNEMAGSQRPQSVKRLRGRPRKICDFTDENAKRDLIEEWARMRQSQGTFSLSGVNPNARLSQGLLHENRNDDDPIPPMRPETITQRTSSDADPVNQTTSIIAISQSQDPTLGCILMQTDTENALYVGVDASGDKPDHDSVLPSDGKTERPVVPSLRTEPPSAPAIDSHIDQDSPAAKLTCDPEVVHNPDLLQYPGFSLPPPSGSPFQENSVHIGHANLTNLPVEEQTEAASRNDPPKHGRSTTFSQTFPLGTDNIELDSDEEFYMLDVPEVFSLPWVPVSSHLYVPPSIGKLISGMREQLMIEARSRRRAEELYQAELSRRVSAEKTIQDLRIKLERNQQDLFGRSTC